MCTLLAPTATGKLIICTAKTNALKIARVAAKFAPYVFLVLYQEKARNGMVIAHVSTNTVMSGMLAACVAGLMGFRIPSGICKP
jgi:hypothetical protein